jgi:hypothetical protein
MSLITALRLAITSISNRSPNRDVSFDSLLTQNNNAIVTQDNRLITTQKR